MEKDEEDSSVTRPPDLWRAIFARVRDDLDTIDLTSELNFT